MKDNQECCDSELSKLQTHYDEIVAKLDKKKEKYRDNTDGKSEK